MDIFRQTVTFVEFLSERLCSKLKSLEFRAKIVLQRRTSHCQDMIIFCDTNWVSQIVIRPKKKVTVHLFWTPAHHHLTSTYFTKCNKNVFAVLTQSTYSRDINRIRINIWGNICLRITFLFLWNVLSALTWKIDIKQRFRHNSVLGEQLHFEIGINNFLTFPVDF